MLQDRVRTQEMPPALTGSDVSSDVTVIEILEAKETPAEFNSPVRITFKPEIKSVDPSRGKIHLYFANKSSTRSLIKMFGPDEEKWEGNKIKLMRVPRENPKTGKQVMGLQVVEEPVTPKAKRK